MKSKKNYCESAECFNYACCEGLCKACYSYLWRWKSKMPRQIMGRARRIYETRLQTLVPAKVAQIRRRAAR